MKLWLICSCSEKTTLHLLNFCSQCHRISCNQCQLFEPAVKYCPQCLHSTYKLHQIFCNRNCFICPRCSISITVTIDKLNNDEDERSYIFKCSGCEWSYKTPLTKKVKSLAKYILDLQSTKNKRFIELSMYYREKSNLSLCEKRSSKSHTSLTSLAMVERLSLGEKLYQLINETYEIEEVDGISEILLPERTHLLCKYDYKCPHCNNTLLKVDPQLNTSRFLKQSFAINLLPNLQLIPQLISHISGDEHITSEAKILALLISNPKPEKSVQLQFSGSDSLFIPIRRWEIPGCKSFKSTNKNTNWKALEEYIRYLPTFKLNNENKLNRTERTRRLGSRFYSNKVNPHNSSSLLLDDLDNVQQPLDQGESWCIVPLKILETAHIHKLNVNIKMNDIETSLYCILE